MVELTAPIALKDHEKRIVYGPVLIPDEPDSDGDVVKADRIEEVAHAFTENYGNVDLQHSLNNVGRLVESYILPVDLPVDDGQVIPKGSWMLGARVVDNDAWDAVKTGKLTGFSIMAVQGAKATGKSAVKQRTTLADLGDTWIVNAVSLVDDPAVPRAKFLAIKSKGTTPQAVSLDRLENILTPALKEIDDMDVEELKELIREIMGEELATMQEQVNNIAQQLGDAANTSQNDATGDAPAAAGKNTGEATGGPVSGDPVTPPVEPAHTTVAGTDGTTGDSATTEPAVEPAEDPAGDDDATTGEVLTAEDMKKLKALLDQLEGDKGNSVKSTPLAAGKSTGASLRITGQDTAAVEKAADIEPDRDAFGRKKR